MADNKAKAYKTLLATKRKEVRRHIENIKDIKALIEAGYETAPRKDDDGTKKRGKQPQPLADRLEDNIDKAMASMSEINFAENQLGIVLTNVAEVNDEVVYLASNRTGKRTSRNESMQQRADLYNDLSKLVAGVDKEGNDFVSSEVGAKLVDKILDESNDLASTFDSSFDADLIVSLNNPAFEGVVKGAPALEAYDGSVYGDRAEYEALEPLAKEDKPTASKPKKAVTKAKAKSTDSEATQRVRTNIGDAGFRDDEQKAEDLKAANAKMLAKAGAINVEKAKQEVTEAKPVQKPAAKKPAAPVSKPVAEAPAPTPAVASTGTDYAALYFEAKAQADVLNHENKMMRAELADVNAQLTALLDVQAQEAKRRQERYSA